MAVLTVEVSNGDSSDYVHWQGQKKKTLRRIRSICRISPRILSREWESQGVFERKHVWIVVEVLTKLAVLFTW